MKLTQAYSKQNIGALFHNIKLQERQGVKREYEIRIDQMTAVPRTGESERFFLFKNQLNWNSRIIEIKLYRGKSRVYDHYIFQTEYELGQQRAKLKEQKEQEYMENLVQSESDYTWLQEKNKRLRKNKKKLKAEVKRLQLENQKFKDNQAVNSIISTLGSMMQPEKSTQTAPRATESENPDTNQTLGALVDQEIFQVYKHFKEKLSTENFHALLGIFTTLGEQPELIHSVHDLILSKLNKDEKTE